MGLGFRVQGPGLSQNCLGPKPNNSQRLGRGNQVGGIVSVMCFEKGRLSGLPESMGSRIYGFRVYGLGFRV